jgi:DNA-binding transcriptional LysR family regulator
MPRLIVELATAKPALHLSLQVDAAATLLSLLRAREIDIAICAVTSPEVAADLVVSEIFTSTPVAVASPKHPLANERPLAVKRFLEFPVAGPRIKGVAGNAIRIADEHDAITQYDSNDYDALIPLALDGLATLIAPDFYARPYVESGALVEVDLELAPIPFAVVTNEVNSFSPIVKEIIRRAQEVGSSLSLGDA